MSFAFIKFLFGWVFGLFLFSQVNFVFFREAENLYLVNIFFFFYLEFHAISFGLWWLKLSPAGAASLASGWLLLPPGEGNE